MDISREGVKRLRNATYPVYAVPPQEWEGDILIGGGYGTTREAASVNLHYDLDVTEDHPNRRIELHSIGPAIPEDPFAADLLNELSYKTAVQNFAHPFRPLEHRPVKDSEKFNATIIGGRLVPRTVHLPLTGPRRLMEPYGDFDRVSFHEYPELRLYRSRRGDVLILMFSWGYDDDFLTDFAAKAQTIANDGDLFDALALSHVAAWERIRRRGRE